ncbi:MAG: hypothetical protein AAGM22_22250 [Acidobacteriota bacterium]
MATKSFQNDARTIELKEKPWKVDREVSLYVKYSAGALEVYSDPDCAGDAITPLQLDVYRNQATGLYFFIAKSSDQGTQFPAPGSGHLPLSWEGNGDCPATVAYGKRRFDNLAFSIADTYDHGVLTEHGFDLIVQTGDSGDWTSTRLFKAIDPTIVEKGEDPPPDARR